MNVNLNLEVSAKVAEMALREAKCGNAERAVELLLQRLVADLDAPSTAPKASKKARTRR